MGVPQYDDEHLSVNFSERLVALDGRKLELRKKEYDLFALLVRHAAQVVPREILLREVWGYSCEVRTRTLDVHVRRLRAKLGNYSDQYIETIFGVGYRFQPFSPPRLVRTVFPSRHQKERPAFTTQTA
jgi:DNA-binding response OmpR family regulator